MRIKMLETSLGASDGVNVRPYQAGETYDVSETLANAFLGDQVAEPTDAPAAADHYDVHVAAPAAKPKAKQRATKNTGAQPENKSA